MLSYLKSQAFESLEAFKKYYSIGMFVSSLHRESTTLIYCLQNMFQGIRVLLMEIYVWLEELVQQDELNCVIMVYGEQYVMILGAFMMPELSVDNLDYQPHVSITMVIAGQYTFISCGAYSYLAVCIHV